MTRRSWLCLTALVGVMVMFLPARLAAAALARHVFIISFDGGKPAVMLQSEMPVFFSRALGGSYTFSAETIHPSLTLPSHTSMLTGVDPKVHGILWNDWQPKRGVITVPTVFELAHERGLTTAMFVSKEKFKHLLRTNSVDLFAIPGTNAWMVTTAVTNCLATNQPNLCFVHLTDGDAFGHGYGWGSAEQIAAFAEQDKALASILQAVRRAGIADTSVFILTADHGGHAKTHGSDRPEDMHIPWVIWGAKVPARGRLSTPVRTYDTAATALWLLGVPVPADWNGRPVREAFESL
jgi:predicted AlkP superfamily pyrophosphatase or phosphodiesterase